MSGTTPARILRTLGMPRQSEWKDMSRSSRTQRSSMHAGLASQENGDIIRHTMEQGIPVFNIDLYIPSEPVFNRILQIDAEKNAETDIANKWITTVAALALASTALPAFKKHPTRRRVLAAGGAGAMLAAASPKIETLLATLQVSPEDTTSSSPFDESSPIRHIQKFFGTLSATELRVLFGQVDFIRAFRDIVFAEKTWRMAERAKAQGLEKTAIKCGGAHNGVEIALRMTPEERMDIIDQVLQNLESHDINPKEVATIRESIALLTEARWNADTNDWDIEIHRYPQ